MPSIATPTLARTSSYLACRAAGFYIEKTALMVLEKEEMVEAARKI